MFTLLTLLFALGTETAPTKSLLFDKVIGLAEAANELISKLDVPGMVNTVEPVCVIAPPAVTDNEPPFVRVIVGNATAV